MAQEAARASRVFRQHDRDLAQRIGRALAQIAQVADGRGDDVERRHSAPSADAHGVAELLLQVFAQPSREPRFQLAHALARDAELVTELLQGEGLVGDQPLLEDRDVFAGQRLAELREAFVQSSDSSMLSAI